MIQKEFKSLLKEHLKYQEFDKCNNILRKEILDFFSQKVLEKNSSFTYSSLENLKSNVTKYLDNTLLETFNKFYFLSIFESNNHYEFQELLDIYKLIEKVFGTEIGIDIKGPRKGDVKRSVLDSTYAKEKTGWQPTISLEEGLKKLHFYLTGK